MLRFSEGPSDVKLVFNVLFGCKKFGEIVLKLELTRMIANEIHELKAYSTANTEDAKLSVALKS